MNIKVKVFTVSEKSIITYIKEQNIYNSSEMLQ